MNKNCCGKGKKVEQLEKNIQQFFDEYLQECQYSTRLRYGTIQGYKEVFKRFISLMPEITEVRLLTTEMLTEFFKRLQTRERIVGNGIRKIGVKNSTIVTYWSKMNSFFEWLSRKSLIQNNPLKSLNPPELNYEDQRALDQESVHKLYSAVTLHSKNALVLRRDIAMLSILLFCGLRLGEFISIEVRDIDFEKQLLTVRGVTSKSKRTRYIPIHPTLMFHLRDYISERNKQKYTTHHLIVSANLDKGLSRHGLKHWVNTLSMKSGVKFHLHQFRHSFACNLAKHDVNAVKIQKLLGHSSLNMTMTYLRSMSTEDMQNEINRLSI
jgi:integrase/recombinase XerD